MGETPNQFYYYQINYNISCVCLSIKEKSLLFFFALTYTLLVSHEGDNTLLSPPQLFSRRRQPFTFSFLTISSKAATLFSLSISHYIFSLPIRRTLGSKPSNSLQYSLFIRLLFLFPTRLGTHYSFNKEQTFLLHQKTIFPSTQRKSKLNFPSSTRKPN